MEVPLAIVGHVWMYIYKRIFMVLRSVVKLQLDNLVDMMAVLNNHFITQA